MQALIITAYQNPTGLLRRLHALSGFVPCYVHADTRGEISKEDLRRMNAMSGVFAISRYAVNWGSVYHLKAILDLMDTALKERENTNLHLISAQDFPTVNHSSFFKCFENDDRLHMQLLHTTDYPELSHRFRHYHFMHLVNYRNMSERTQNLVGRIDRFQDAVHVNRRLSLPNKGLVWCSLPRGAAEHALFAPQNRKLLRRLRYTYIPEEFYFQNAFFGTEWEKKITGNALRFSVWDQPERGVPALLNMSDFPEIDASGCVFCRKVNTDTSLYTALEERWNSSDPN